MGGEGRRSVGALRLTAVHTAPVASADREGGWVWPHRPGGCARTVATRPTAEPCSPRDLSHRVAEGGGSCIANRVKETPLPFSTFLPTHELGKRTPGKLKFTTDGGVSGSETISLSLSLRFIESFPPYLAPLASLRDNINNKHFIDKNLKLGCS